MDENLDDAQLVLITSNHGANGGGEEYNRRWHYVYLNGTEILRYIPGRTSCEPFRKYNTQGNDIYGYYPKTDAQWQQFSNWCPGDVIDTRIIKLGALQAGEYQFTIEVPDAVFREGEGNFPLSLFFQGKKGGTIAGRPQTRYTVKGNVTHTTGIPLEGVRIGGSFSLTNSAGQFTVVADSNAIVQLMPVLDGYTFNPVWLATPRLSADLDGQNFVAAGNVGMEDAGSGASLVVYPNPAVAEIHVKLNSPKTENYIIYDVAGQAVQRGKIQGSATVNIELLTKGIYYLQIADTVTKVVKI